MWLPYLTLPENSTNFVPEACRIRDGGSQHSHQLLWSALIQRVTEPWRHKTDIQINSVIFRHMVVSQAEAISTAEAAALSLRAGKAAELCWEPRECNGSLSICSKQSQLRKTKQSSETFQKIMVIIAADFCAALKVPPVDLWRPKRPLGSAPQPHLWSRRSSRCCTRSPPPRYSTAS